MGITFKGTSEYNRNFTWVPSYKSASFEPLPIQAAVPAGMATENQGLCLEPALQHKKPVETSAAKASITLEQPNAFLEQNNEYMLLGSQEKFVPNVKYMTKKAFVQQAPEPSPAKTPDAPRPVISTPPAPKFDTGAPKRSKSKSKPKLVQELLRSESNVAVQTRLDDKEKVAHAENQATAEYALQYRAGLARRASQAAKQRRSEYAKQFGWKTGFKDAPLLAAEQIVYNSNPSLPLARPDPVPRTSEYRRQFSSPERPQPVDSGTKSEKQKDGKDVETSKQLNKTEDANGDVDAQEVKVSKQKGTTFLTQNPQRPFFPHKRTNTWLSEYNANYALPARFSYTEGAWRGAPAPQLLAQPQTSQEEPTPPKSSWFAEVVELRRRAEEYKKRANGTHFSREHMSQLLARNAQLWDATSSTARSTERSSSMIDALSLEQPRSAPQPCQPNSNRAKRVADVMAKETSSESLCEEIEESSLPPQATTKEKAELLDKERKATKTKTSSKKKSGQIEKRKRKGSKQVEDGVKTQGTQVPVEVCSVQTQKPSARESYQSRNSVRSDASTSTLVNAPDTERDESELEAGACASTSSTANEVLQQAFPAAPGRITTPQIRQSGDFVIRHHLDRTTPAVGGTLLTAPKINTFKKQKKSVPQEKKALALVQGSLSNGEQPAVDLEKVNTAPMYGAPTRDMQPLRDENSESDTLLQTKYVDSPLKHADLRSALHREARLSPSGKKSKVINPKQLSPIEEGYSQTFKGAQQAPQKEQEATEPSHSKPAPKTASAMPWPQGYLLPDKPSTQDDDTLSVSNCSVVSSCSLASEVLERAHRRQADFWGDKAKR